MGRRIFDLSELKVVSAKAAFDGTATFDPYVPLSLSFSEGVGPIATIVIRTQDDRTLVDLGIDMSTGRLTGATLVTTSVDMGDVSRKADTLAIRHGIPCFSTEKFDHESFAPSAEIVTTIHVHDDAQRLSVYWGDQLPDAKILCGEAVVFLRNEMMIGFGANRTRGLDH